MAWRILMHAAEKPQPTAHDPPHGVARKVPLLERTADERP